MNILDACDDPRLFKPWFKNPATWQAWRAFLATLFGLPMTPEQAEVHARCTDRPITPPPGDVVTEAWCVVGRRGGKSFVLALVAVFLACFRDYREHLQPGERGGVLVIAADRKQARTIFRYARAMLTRIPMLNKMVEWPAKAESIDLKNSVTIEIGTASFRAARGSTLVAAICDELAFWHTDDIAA